jgi:phage shock protein A
MQLFKRVELTEGATVQFVGVYALKWKYGEWGMPEWGFVELEGDYDELLEEHKALQELLAVRDAEVEELRQENKRLRVDVKILEERVWRRED